MLAQEEEYVPGYLLLRTYQIHIGEQEMGGNPYIWLDDDEVKIYSTNENCDVYNFEGDITTQKYDNGGFSWTQKAHNKEDRCTATIQVYKNPEFPQVRIIGVHFTETNQLTFSCDVISKNGY